MKIEIEDYKNHTIFYDEDSDKFICDISVEDNAKSTARKSLKAVRADIDKFIRDNMDFKSFKFISIEWGNELRVLDVVALRSDRRAVVENGVHHNKSYYTASDFKETFEYDSGVMEQYKSLNDGYVRMRKEYEDNIKKLQPLLKPLDVTHLNLVP